ncbi:unnamed protein product [Anisakis simplex]|uniref:RRM domain-containing protein n=1 Tax=Anisakis simplex TaxID=6269 RepID=A0A0M3IXY3_ANISI|nr:unnamed protein product [Anisakis simplex]
MDEEELLFDSSLAPDVKLGDLDEAAILDDIDENKDDNFNDNDDEDVVRSEGNGDGTKKVSTSNIDLIDENEELDYDEEPNEDATEHDRDRDHDRDHDHERSQRRSKFTSERISSSLRRTSAVSNSGSTLITSVGPSKDRSKVGSRRENENSNLVTPSLPTTTLSVPASVMNTPSSLLSQSTSTTVSNPSVYSSNAQLNQYKSSSLSQPKSQSKVLINPHYKGIIRPRSELAINWNTAIGVRSVTNIGVPQIRPPFITTNPLIPNANIQIPPPSLPFLPLSSSSSATDLTRLAPPSSSMGCVVSSSSIVHISANYPTPPPLTSIYGGAAAIYSTNPPPASIPPPLTQLQQAPGVSVASSSQQWDQMVEGFLRRTTIRRHSRSTSSHSSSSSYSSRSSYSRSRSRSYSSRSRSSTSSESSRSSIRSLRHEQRFKSKHSSSSRYNDARMLRNGSKSRRRYMDRPRGTADNRVEYRDRDRRTRPLDSNQQEKTMECAKAIGLDSDYLTKLEEQKKMREEILRKKEERRVQNVQSSSKPPKEPEPDDNGDGNDARASGSMHSSRHLPAQHRTSTREQQQQRFAEKRNVSSRERERSNSERMTGMNRNRPVRSRAGGRDQSGSPRERPTASSRLNRGRREQSPSTFRRSGSSSTMNRDDERGMSKMCTPSFSASNQPSSSYHQDQKQLRASSRSMNANQKQEQKLSERPILRTSDKGGDGTAAAATRAVPSNGAVSSRRHSALKNTPQPSSSTQSKSPSVTTPNKLQPNATASAKSVQPPPSKKKAYLAVVIKTSNRTSPDMERMKLIAATVGPTRKVWQSHDDSVSLIFESHDNAKKFMLQYNGKIMNGVRLFVMLEKVFVNLAEL